MGTTLESTATDQKDGTKTTVSPVTPPSPQYLSSWRLYLVIACLFFGAFLIALDTNIINVAIPKISSEFHSLHDVAWYGTAYLLRITPFQPIYGSLYKYFETTMIYRSSIIVFELGTILCAAAVSSNMFIVGRASWCCWCASMKIGEVAK